MVCPKFKFNGEPDKISLLTDANISPQGSGITIMSKSNNAEKSVVAAEVAEVKTVEAAAAPES